MWEVLLRLMWERNTSNFSSKMLKLNLGCGMKKYPGFINIDSDFRVNPNIVRDIERGLPFSDNTVEQIITEHFLEHVNPDLIHFVIYEMWRVLAKKGILKIVVPIGKSWMNSIEHKTHFEEFSWIFFTNWTSHGYKFNLIKSEVVRAGVPELDRMGYNSEGFGDELRFELECVK